MTVINLRTLIEEITDPIEAAVEALNATVTAESAKTALGVNAGAGAGASLRLVAIGTDAAKSVVEVDGVVAVGWNAASTTTKGPITAIGHEALRNVVNDGVEGRHNTAVGWGAARGVTNASGVCAIGHQALMLSNGAQNCAVGTDSMASCLTGSQNTAVGGDSLSVLVDGHNNVAVGYEAGAGLTNSSSNVVVGYDALYKPNADVANKTTTGTRHTVIGFECGANSPTQRDDCVLVGYRALFGASQATAIGSGAQALHASSVALGYGAVTTAADQVMVGGRDIEITNTAKGLVIKSPDGTRYRVQVANGGALSTVAL